MVEDNHDHNGINSKKIPGRSIVGAPQDALTTANSGTINSGDATTDTVIANMRTRISELETRLQNLGLIR